MNKKLFLAIALMLLAVLVLGGCGGGGNEQPPAEDQSSEQPAEQPEEQTADSQPAEQGQDQPQEQADADADAELVFVSSADKPGCVDCHQIVSEDQDYSLTTEIKNIEGHPPLEVEGVADCVTCHQGDGDLSLNKILHIAHYGSEDSHFVTNYEGSCVQCHKLTADGKLTVAGLEEAGTKFVTIEVATVDKSPGGCNDCHKKISDDQDYSLAAEIKNIEGHPSIPAESVADCMTCHNSEGSMPMNTILHNAHLLGEHYKDYGNSCINCHDQANKMAVKGL